MKIAVCDDEIVYRDEISDLLRKYQLDRKIDVFIDVYKNGTELLSSEYPYDVIFMDYQMSGLDGIETCRRLRESNRDTVIIFISAYPTAALDSFEVNTFRFLAKPIDKGKMYRALDDYLKSIENDSIFVLNTHDGKWFIKLSDVIYLEAAGKRTLLRTNRDTYDIHNNLKSLEKMLPQDRFIRCHKAFVVSFAHIINYTGSDVMFDNGEKAHIGRHYLAQFREGFQNYILKFNKGIMI